MLENHIRRILSNQFSFSRVPCRLLSAKFDEDVEYFPFNKSDHQAQRLYVWGCAEHGALGELKVRSKKAHICQIGRPIRKQFSYTHRITDIACGYGFSLFGVKTETYNKLFGCGLNSDSQIGYHDPRRAHPLKLVLSMVPIRLPLKSTKKTNVIKVAAGRAHSMALTDKEGAFLFGNNAYGQCARPPTPEEDYNKFSVPNHIPSLEGEHIIDIICGQDHSLFITDAHSVFSCGWGADGQTGQGHYRSTWEPARIGGDIKGEKITKISSTSDCILALNDKGEVFGWGNSEYHQLLTPDDMQQLPTPIYIRKLKQFGKIIDIAAGGTFCMVLNENGDVFVWGFGTLGKGPNFTMSETPEQIPPALFGRNEFHPNSVVTSISCGVQTMMAVTNYGDLYSWGRNKFGQLGLGHLKDQYFPLKVALMAKIKKICCGVDHTIALCKPFQ